MYNYIKKCFVCSLIIMLFIPTISNAVESPYTYSGAIDLALELDANTSVSGVMSLEEIANELAQDKGISFADAKEILGYDGPQTCNSRATGYRTLTRELVVTNEYHPELKYYVKTSEYSGPDLHTWGILSIEDLTLKLVDSSSGINKQFSGKVYTNLEAANKIFYRVSGTFYNDGTTTISGGIELGIGEYADLNFSVSYSSNVYKGFYEEDRIHTGQ